jgi:hypothetical protein
MRHPPSPLLLSARKRRPRRNPPRGAQLGSPTPGEQRAEDEMQQQQQAQAAGADEKCALLTPDPAAPEAHDSHESHESHEANAAPETERIHTERSRR